MLLIHTVDQFLLSSNNQPTDEKSLVSFIPVPVLTVNLYIGQTKPDLKSHLGEHQRSLDFDI